MKVNKKELIEKISRNQDQLPHRDIELAVKTIINCMTQALSTGDRIEIRGFGSFSLRYRRPRIGRNPKTGKTVNINVNSLTCFWITAYSWSAVTK